MEDIPPLISAVKAYQKTVRQRSVNSKIVEMISEINEEINSNIRDGNFECESIYEINFGTDDPEGTLSDDIDFYVLTI